MKLTTLALFFLIFVSSCTVEKRLHNRGWNVQWKKHHKVSKENCRTAGISTLNTDPFESRPLDKMPPKVEQDVLIIQERTEMNENGEGNFQELTSISEQVSDRETKMGINRIRKVFQNLKNQAPVFRSAKSTENPAEKHKLGRFFLILAIILIVLAFVLPALTSTSLIEGLTALALSILFLPLGLIFLIIGSSMIKRSKKSSTE